LTLAIADALGMLGKTPESVTVDDLASVDEFHIGGRQATEELVKQLVLAQAFHVLEVGSGHPEKTRIVYCKDDDRTGRHPNEGFEFLGYTFRPRRAKNRRGEFFVSFLPAVSNGAAQKMRQEMRRWRIPLRSDKAIDDLARMWNAVLRGWIAYFGRFYKSALYPTFRHFNELLTRWAMRKYKRLRRHRRRAEHWLGGVARREPRLFAHWHLLGVRPTAG
jgi:RNA-directed DNA polymerase